MRLTRATQPLPTRATVNPAGSALVGHPVQPAPAMGVVVAEPLQATAACRLVKSSRKSPRSAARTNPVPPRYRYGRTTREFGYEPPSENANPRPFAIIRFSSNVMPQ